MSTVAMPTTPVSLSPFPTYPVYDEESSFQQECLNTSLPQHLSVAEYDPLSYSTTFPVSYSAPAMTPQPLSIYTNNLDNFSKSSLSSAASVSSAYYSDLGFQCGVESQWTHVDDGYVSGGTSPVTQTMPHDTFYSDTLALLDGASLANLDMSSQMEPTSILGETASGIVPPTAEQLQYMFDPSAQSPAMSVAGLGMIDPLSTEVYNTSSAESSPTLPSARSKSVGGSRSPSPTSQQSYYSTFDNKGSLMKCPHKGCTKAFGRVYNLKTHLKSHVSTKPWECPMCPRSFTRKHDLQRHVRVHTGQKPYVCPCCHKRFARTDALTRHIRVEDSCRLSEEVANYKGRRRYSDLS